MVSHKYEEKNKKNYNNTIKDAPSLCDNNALLKKQKVDMCKLRVLSPMGVLTSLSLWFSPFLALGAAPLIPVKKLQSKIFSHLFSMG
jgi:hypothetical protein